MEQQLRLQAFDKELFGRSVVKLVPKKKSLELEKDLFIQTLNSFIEPLNFETLQLTGRPKSDMKTIIKSLLLMSFNGDSYRRTQSDLKKMVEEEMIRKIIPKSTLNDYANDENTKRLLEKLIQISAMFFNENENTLLLDSTWLAPRMYTGGYRKVYDKTSAPLQKVRKIHVACLKNSKVICCAKATAGTVNDSPIAEELIRSTVDAGFKIETLLADAGYLSKDLYSLCQELGILKPYINFRKNNRIKGGKSNLWKERLKVWKENPEMWHETYRYRVLIEGVFSAIKRKQQNWLRSRTELAQDIELLLKCLVYNITIIGKYS